MADLIERKPLYEQTAKLEAQALDYVGRLIERDGEEPSEEWRVWSAILKERTAFKHDVFDAPSAQPEPHWIPCSERLPEEKINQNTKDFEKVLCTTVFGDVRAYAFGTPIGTKEPHFWNGQECVDKYVVAWQYMPKPYQEEIE